MTARQKKTLQSAVYCLLISAVLVCVGFAVLPAFFAEGFGGQWGVRLALALAALAAVVVLFSLYFHMLRGGAGRDAFGKTVAGTALTFLILLAGVLVVSLLYGALAVLLQKMLAGSMGIPEIKGVVSMVTGALTILLLPVFMAALFGVGYGEDGVLAGIKAGLAGLRGTYWKLLGVAAAGALLGVGVNMLLAPGSILFGLATGVKVVLFSLLGMAGIFFSAKICAPKA